MPRKNNLTPEAMKGTQFSKERQPAPGKISAGKLKAKVGRELAAAVLNLPANRGLLLTRVNKLLRQVGMDELSEVTFEQALNLQKILLALSSRSENVRLYAAESLMNRAYGLPKQIQEVTNTTPQVVVNVGDKETKDEIDKLK